MEKVIKEIRVIETDDGFRIEIKGDKEAMAQWKEHFKSHGPMNCGGHGPMHRMHRMRRKMHNRMHHGPWAAGFWGHGMQSCCEETEEPETAEEE